MPLYATTAHNAMLDKMWDTVPAFEVGLLSSDPRQTGTVDEVLEAGRVAGTSADWAPAASRSKVMATKTLPAASGDYSAPGRRWGIWVSGELWDHGPLAEEITAAAGDTPAIRIRVGFNEGLI